MSDVKKTLERRSARVPAKSSKCKRADERAKKTIPNVERMISDAVLKQKQGGIDVNDSKKLINSVEGKISTAEEVFHNTVMHLTNNSAMGDALWFQLGEDLGRFSINEFCLITGLN
ncbi:hypothetical protein TIFTF001_023229 [Ficus carica]|uniref:Uncharacterized protein n=1 Tax=Ficus carica TaxID=3494 RepID=A0AA88DG43_FICCA|nr:hypothetical protein TIFTF001_023229 [Ficus carica]